jgi:magnesium chelatase subunit I
VHAHVSALCIDAAVDGLRADLVMLRAARALAALEQAGAVTVEHVECVAEAVLIHRRRQRRQDDGQADGDTRNGEGQPQTSSGFERPPASALDAAPSPAVAGENDWGYLPPEPAATTHVKRVLPLDAKKR